MICFTIGKCVDAGERTRPAAGCGDILCPKLKGQSIETCEHQQTLILFMIWFPALCFIISAVKARLLTRWLDPDVAEIEPRPHRAYMLFLGTQTAEQRMDVTNTYISNLTTVFF